MISEQAVLGISDAGDAAVAQLIDADGKDPELSLLIFDRAGAKDRRDWLDGKDRLNPGVGEMIASPSFFSVAYTHDYDAVLTARELNRHGHKTIGWVGRGRLQYDLVRVVEAQVSGASFVDSIRTRIGESVPLTI